MNIHAIICTRSREDISPTTDKLLAYLCQCGIAVYLLTGAKSIFSAYHGAFEKLDTTPEDIVIFCHDDIEIRDRPEVFLHNLTGALDLPNVGFVGPAGTTRLDDKAVWWCSENWNQGFHRGKVTHLDPSGNEYLTTFGPPVWIPAQAPHPVVVLDGLFLAAKSSTIKEVGLQKPEYFEGEWDFYDIHYTSKAFLKGYSNFVIDMTVLHNSRGELVGRESWHKNKEAFIRNNNLPIGLR